MIHFWCRFPLSLFFFLHAPWLLLNFTQSNFFVYRMIYLLMILFCRWEIINVVLSLLITIFILNFMLQVLTRPPLQMRTTKCLPGLTIVTISTWLFSNPSQSHYIIVLAFTFHCRFDWVFVMNLLSKNWTSNPLMFLQVQNAMVWRFNFVNRKVKVDRFFSFWKFYIN